MPIVTLVLGIVVGAAAAVLWSRASSASLFAQVARATAEAEERLRERNEAAGLLDRCQEELAAERANGARLAALVEGERRAAEERAIVQAEARDQLVGTFAQLSRDALAQNADHFLREAKEALAGAHREARVDMEGRSQAVAQLVEPVQATLTKVEAQLQQFELKRAEAFADLQAQVRSLHESERMLQAETSNLVTALRAPASRGRWGELQLRRVIELAGMVPHCDFAEQVVAEGDAGVARADVVVRLPGGTNLVVDAKVPMASFLQATERATAEDDRRKLLRNHARQLRGHVSDLARKRYWEQYEPAPEFVVMFVPGDALLSVALEHDPELLDFAFESKVLITTPTTLIATLRSAAWGWRQEAIARDAREVAEAGRKVYRRLSTMAQHLDKLGRSLESSVKAYNSTVGSMESSVLPAARRFDDLHVGNGSLGSSRFVEALPRAVSAKELLDLDGEDRAPSREPLAGSDEDHDGMEATA